MVFLIIKNKWSLLSETSCKSSSNKESKIAVSNPCPNIEILYGKFSDHQIAKNNSQLSSGGVISPVEIRLVGGSGNNVVHFLSFEP